MMEISKIGCNVVYRT